MKKIVKYGSLTILLLLLGFVAYYWIAVSIDEPENVNKDLLKLERKKLGDNFYVLGNNWLRKSKSGLWEMYVEGEPFERGVVTGKLAKELIIKQEDEFVSQIKQLIPSTAYLSFLKYITLWFNRNIDDHVVDEYKKEIYGESFSASENYDYIGTNYERIFNYHASHDIGHALQDKNYIPGCTAFSAWSGAVADSTLIVGRNFDFYVGDGFAQDKIIFFMKPDSGYKFMFVTWGGFLGVVSGMNEKGLTVTLNASKSDIPSSSATPISILAREILQYASNIKEAYAIAEKRKTFVSESIMIGSAEDDKTFIIEKSPARMGLYETRDLQIRCSNHFQSDLFTSPADIMEQSSEYRYRRLRQLMNRYDKLDERTVAIILRDQKGLDDRDIGMGNEKAMNQLLAHHSIIFKPKQRLVWISSNPWQLGEYVAYDLNKVFKLYQGLKEDKEIAETALIIPADTFLNSESYRSFLKFKQGKKNILEAIRKKLPGLIPKEVLNDFVKTNPEFYYTWWLAGDYCKINENDFASALKYYQIALTKEVPRVNETEYLNNAIKQCQESLKKP